MNPFTAFKDQENKSDQVSPVEHFINNVQEKWSTLNNEYSQIINSQISKYIEVISFLDTIAVDYP